MSTGKCVYASGPDASPSPDDAKVAGAQDPEDAIEDMAVVHPRDTTRLVRQQWFDGSPFIVCKFVAHDSSPCLEALNHREYTTVKILFTAV